MGWEPCAESPCHRPADLTVSATLSRSGQRNQRGWVPPGRDGAGSQSIDLPKMRCRTVRTCPPPMATSCQIGRTTTVSGFPRRLTALTQSFAPKPGRWRRRSTQRTWTSLKDSPSALRPSKRSWSQSEQLGENGAAGGIQPAEAAAMADTCGDRLGAVGGFYGERCQPDLDALERSHSSL